MREPDAQKFSDINEAYQVLSVRESRTSYDVQRKKNPENYAAMSEFEFNLENRPEVRDKTGQVPKEPVKRGSYAEDRLAQLKRDRDLFSVNHLGYYKGGLPRKDMGAVRGKSLGNPGEFHTPEIHNFLEYKHQDTHFVTQEDAVKFKHWMATDQLDFQRARPYYPMHYDKNFDFLRDRSYFLGLILTITLGSIGYRKYLQERNRWSQWGRTEKLNEVLPHHVSNRGGVLFEKEFIGFEKYHQNNDSLMNWYKKAYPHQFKEAAAQ